MEQINASFHKFISKWTTYNENVILILHLPFVSSYITNYFWNVDNINIHFDVIFHLYFPLITETVACSTELFMWPSNVRIIWEGRYQKQYL